MHPTHGQGHWHKKCFKREPWISNFICSQNPKVTGETLYILRNIAGPLDDGSCIKEASDGDVSIEAVFSKTSLEKFSAGYPEGETPNWNRSLIIVRKYCRLHKTDKLKNNCKFQLRVDDFSLWALQDGFKPKTIPLYCMEIKAVRRLSDKQWLDWRLKEASASSTDEEEDEDCSMASIPLSQLLDEVSQDSDMETPFDRQKNKAMLDTADKADPGSDNHGRLQSGVNDPVFSKKTCLLEACGLPVQLARTSGSDCSYAIRRDADKKKSDSLPEWISGKSPSAPVVQQCEQSNILLSEEEEEEDSLGDLMTGLEEKRPEGRTAISYSNTDIPGTPEAQHATLSSFRVVGTCTYVNKEYSKSRSPTPGTSGGMQRESEEEKEGALKKGTLKSGRRENGGKDTYLSQQHPSSKEKTKDDNITMGQQTVEREHTEVANLGQNAEENQGILAHFQRIERFGGVDVGDYQDKAELSCSDSSDSFVFFDVGTQPFECQPSEHITHLSDPLKEATRRVSDDHSDEIIELCPEAKRHQTLLSFTVVRKSPVVGGQSDEDHIPDQGGVVGTSKNISLLSQSNMVDLPHHSTQISPELNRKAPAPDFPLSPVESSQGNECDSGKAKQPDVDLRNSAAKEASNFMKCHSVQRVGPPKVTRLVRPIKDSGKREQRHMETTEGKHYSDPLTKQSKLEIVCLDQGRKLVTPVVMLTRIDETKIPSEEEQKCDLVALKSDSDETGSDSVPLTPEKNHSRGRFISSKNSSPASGNTSTDCVPSTPDRRRDVKGCSPSRSSKIKHIKGHCKSKTKEIQEKRNTSEESTDCENSTNTSEPMIKPLTKQSKLEIVCLDRGGKLVTPVVELTQIDDIKIPSEEEQKCDLVALKSDSDETGSDSVPLTPEKKRCSQGRFISSKNSSTASGNTSTDCVPSTPDRRRDVKGCSPSRSLKIKHDIKGHCKSKTKEIQEKHNTSEESTDCENSTNTSEPKIKPKIDKSSSNLMLSPECEKRKIRKGLRRKRKQKFEDVMTDSEKDISSEESSDDPDFDPVFEVKSHNYNEKSTNSRGPVGRGNKMQRGSTSAAKKKMGRRDSKQVLNSEGGIKFLKEKREPHERDVSSESDDPDFEPAFEAKSRKSRQKNSNRRVGRETVQKGSSSTAKKSRCDSKRVLNTEGRIEFLKEKKGAIDVDSLYRKRLTPSISSTSTGRKRRLFSEVTRPLLGAPLEDIEEASPPKNMLRTLRKPKANLKDIDNIDQGSSKNKDDTVHIKTSGLRSKHRKQPDQAVLMDEEETPSSQTCRSSGSNSLIVSSLETAHMSKTVGICEGSSHIPEVSPRISGKAPGITSTSPRIFGLDPVVMISRSPTLTRKGTDSSPGSASDRARVSKTVSSSEVSRHTPEVQIEASSRISGDARGIQTHISPRIFSLDPVVLISRSPNFTRKGTDSSPGSSSETARMSKTVSSCEGSSHISEVSARISGEAPGITSTSPRIFGLDPVVMISRSPNLTRKGTDSSPGSASDRARVSQTVSSSEVSRHTPEVSPRISRDARGSQTRTSPRIFGLDPVVMISRSPNLTRKGTDSSPGSASDRARVSQTVSSSEVSRHTPEVSPRISRDARGSQTLTSPRILGLDPVVMISRSPNLTRKGTDSSPGSSSETARMSKTVSSCEGSSHISEVSPRISGEAPGITSTSPRILDLDPVVMISRSPNLTRKGTDSSPGSSSETARMSKTVSSCEGSSHISEVSPRISGEAPGITSTSPRILDLDPVVMISRSPNLTRKGTDSSQGSSSETAPVSSHIPEVSPRISGDARGSQTHTSPRIFSLDPVVLISRSPNFTRKGTDSSPGSSSETARMSKTVSSCEGSSHISEVSPRISGEAPGIQTRTSPQILDLDPVVMISRSPNLTRKGTDSSPGSASDRARVSKTVSSSEVSRHTPEVSPRISGDARGSQTHTSPRIFSLDPVVLISRSPNLTRKGTDSSPGSSSETAHVSKTVSSSKVSRHTPEVQTEVSPRISGEAPGIQIHTSPRILGLDPVVMISHSLNLAKTGADLNTPESPRMSEKANDVQHEKSPRICQASPNVQTRASPRLAIMSTKKIGTGRQISTETFELGNSLSRSTPSPQIQVRNSPRLSSKIDSARTQTSPALSNTTREVQVQIGSGLPRNASDVQTSQVTGLRTKTSKASNVETRTISTPSTTTDEVLMVTSPRLSKKAFSSSRFSTMNSEVKSRSSPRLSRKASNDQTCSPKLAARTSEVEIKNSPRRSTKALASQTACCQLSRVGPEVQCSTTPHSNESDSEFENWHLKELGKVQTRSSPRLHSKTREVQTRKIAGLSSRSSLSLNKRATPVKTLKHADPLSRATPKCCEFEVTSEDEAIQSSRISSSGSAGDLSVMTPVNSLPSHQPQPCSSSRETLSGTPVDVTLSSQNLQNLLDSFGQPDMEDLEALQNVRFPERVVRQMCCYLSQAEFGPGST